MKRLIVLMVITAASASAVSVVAATTLQFAVTAVAGRSVFIDKGRTAGIVPGLRVRFSPAGSISVDGVVSDASTTSARIDLISGDVPPLGTIGVATIPDPTPAKGVAATQPATRPTTIPSHPPWERQDGVRSPDMPLLSPAYSRPPNERPWNIHGRVYTDFEGSIDQGGTRTNRYSLWRTGTAFTATNPFGMGGEFRFDGEYDYRNADLSSADSNSQNDVLIKRISYAIGTELYAPYRIEMGRFTSYYLPEIGLVDGVEAAARFQNGFNLGGGIGGYPRPFVHDDLGQDIGFHLFADYTAKTPSELSGTIGYQHTWRDGVPDRDLLIGHASVFLQKSLWLYGSATADIYPEGNGTKSAGPQLTSALFQARYTPGLTQGASLLYSRFTWADIRGRDFPTVTRDLLREGRVDRMEVALWREIVPNVRPTIRLYYFDSDRANGFGSEFDLDWTNIGGKPIDLHSAIFYADGEFTNDWGFRTEASLRNGNLDVSLGYKFLRYEFPGTQTSSGMTDRHTLRASVGWQTGNWYYSARIDRDFGKADDMYLFGTYLEYRF